jgi:deoxyribodipyrimidine photo-lyase
VRKKLASYAERRDLLAKDATSRLSAHLANGTISIREVYHAAREVRSRGNAVARTSADTFITELIWREFFYQILAHHPFVLRRSFRDGIPADSWSGTRRHLRAWCEGRTGYPIVDAGMRQLNSEGWMHNRARMIVASFLVKDLHIDWRKGERYFLDRLIDADLASNNGGWQWVAGTGTDASPWFRIFNPVTQSRRFDPSGAYIRRYVPELASVPAPLVHSPWLMSRDDQVRTHCRIGKDYPLPIVDHNVERAVALAMFRVAKTGGRGGEP